LEPSAEQQNLKLSFAGLQAGCLGSLAMIGWWLLGSSLQRHSLWSIPNLLATIFYGDRAFGPGLRVSTLAGLALPFVVYSVLGVLFALAARERKGGLLLVLAGLLAGLAFNWLIFGVALEKIDPDNYLYLPLRPLLVSHLLYGVMLATYPAFARRFEAPGSAPNQAASDQKVGGRVS
jgi:hypothetical protein